MFVSNTLLWLSTVIAITGAVKPSKNAHGSSDIIQKFPYLVGLAAADGPININETVCSGTLISPDFVLTSAHCTLLFEARKIRVFSRKSVTSIKTRLAVVVYVHRSYDSGLRSFDLSLVKLKRPFEHVNRFVKLSSKKFDRDQDMDCVVVGISGTDGNSYEVPVRAKYGRSACQIPNDNPAIKYVLGYTWTDFLCTRMVGPAFSSRLPCGRSDPLLCGRNRQYGMISYGYDVDGDGSEPVECGDPNVQSRSLYVNKHYKWIADQVSGNPEDKVSVVTATDGQSSNGTSTITPTPTVSTPKPTSSTPTPTSSTLTISTTTISTKTISTPTPTPTSRTPTKRVGSTPGDYPYLVRLQGLANEPTCGGTLISPYHVLTSAYCTTRMTDIYVIATNHRVQYTSADDIYLPVAFDVPTLTADISIIVLRDPFDVGKYAEIADFPDPSDGNETAVMSCAVVAKMPEAPYYYHRSVDASYGAKACRNASVLKIQKYVDQTSREFICGLYENRLKEDAGNPLICDGKQYGVISHGYQIEHPNANITQQMRFLAVKNYKRWIAKVIAKTKPPTSEGIRVKNRRRGLITAVIVLLLSDAFRRL